MFPWPKIALKAVCYLERKVHHVAQDQENQENQEDQEDQTPFRVRSVCQAARLLLRDFNAYHTHGQIRATLQVRALW